MKCKELIEKMEALAPVALAEKWDNPGLIVGDATRDIKKILVALDVTNEVVDEAINIGADFIVTHHPLLFSGIKQITAQSPTGNKLIKLIENKIGHFAMHTNLDTAFGGTNDKLAEIIGLINLEVLAPATVIEGTTYGLGRIGDLPKMATLEDVARIIKTQLSLDTVRIVGDRKAKINRVGLCTGSGIDFMEDAIKKNANLYITADIRYHESQKALDAGICIIDATHYASENIIVPVIHKFLTELNGDFTVVQSSVNGQVFSHV